MGVAAGEVLEVAVVRWPGQLGHGRRRLIDPLGSQADHRRPEVGLRILRGSPELEPGVPQGHGRPVEVAQGA